MLITNNGNKDRLQKWWCILSLFLSYMIQELRHDNIIVQLSMSYIPTRTSLKVSNLVTVILGSRHGDFFCFLNCAKRMLRWSINYVYFKWFDTYIDDSNNYLNYSSDHDGLKHSTFWFSLQTNSIYLHTMRLPNKGVKIGQKPNPKLMYAYSSSSLLPPFTFVEYHA